MASGAAAGAGVTRAFEIIHKELETTMGLCGVNRIAEIGRREPLRAGSSVSGERNGVRRQHRRTFGGPWQASLTGAQSGSSGKIGRRSRR